MELSAGNSPPPSQHSNVLLSPLLIAGGILSGVALLLLAFHLILKSLRPSPPSEKPFREHVTEVLRSIPSQRLAAQISPTECSVCLSDVKEGQRIRILPSCGHAFHALCIDAWLRTRLNCPLCRSPLQQPSSISSAV